MSGKQGGGGGSGYDPSNKMHQESYWEGRPDPRDRADDDKYMRFTSNYYKVVDRQIASDHAQDQQRGGGGGRGQKK